MLQGIAGAGSIADPAVATGGAGGLDPTGAFLALTVASTLFGANAQREAGRSQRRLAEYKAQIADFEAEDALERGEVGASRRRTQTKGVIGAQRAFLASQGVDINRGSAVDVQANARYLGELDAMTIINNAARESWGYRVQAEDYRMRGEIAERTGDMGALTTIAGGGGRLLLAKMGFGRSALSTDPII